MKNIKDYNLEELKQELISLGEKPFRAEQIFKWLYIEKVHSFDEMTNLSLDLREKLKQNYDICNFNIVKKLLICSFPSNISIYESKTAFFSFGKFPLPLICI